jgi:putative FmdB family regulatory protein
MPTYEYKCDACGHAFEKFQSIKASPIRKCPNCGKMKVRKLISKGAGLIFKGSGFYITDYRSEGYKDQAKAEGGGAAKSDSKDAGGGGGSGEGKGDSKSESKPAAESAPAKTESKAEAKPAATASSKSDSKPTNSSKSEKK